MQGISFNSRKKLWQARIFAAGKSISLGYWQEENDAARAVDFALEYVGRPKANFPNESIPRRIVDRVRPKMVAWRKQRLFNATKGRVHSCIWYWGYAPGEQWAAGQPEEESRLVEAEGMDPEKAIDWLGVRVEFETVVDLYPGEFRGARTFAAKQAVWLSGFLEGVRNKWKRSKQVGSLPENPAFDLESIL